MATTEPVIQVKDLTARYGDDTILDHVSFEVQEGEIFIILGGSGCGKSTLLKHVIGLMHPYAGEVLVEGEDIVQCGEIRFREILKKFGVLFQSGALFGSMTLAENILLPVEANTDLPKEAIETLIRMKLRLVHLAGYENHLPSELSGGMKKRAALARAMALNPRILFFDEPSAGLDPVSAAELDQLILKINRSLGTTMVIVTHDLASIFAVAQRVIMLDKRAKGIIAEGDPVHLRDHHPDPLVRQFFNREAEEKNG